MKSVSRWLALVVTAAALPVGAAEVAVFPVNGIHLSAGAAEAIGAVMASAYARVTGLEVVGPQLAARAVREGGALSAAAQALAVREYLEITAVGLGNGSEVELERQGDRLRLSAGDDRIVVQATRRAQSGEMLYRAEMTALSLGDMENVAPRLARALLERKPPQETLTLDTVTRREATAQNRTFTEKLVGVKAATAVPLSRGDRWNPLVGVGLDIRLEASTYFLEIGGNAYVPANGPEGNYSFGGLGAEIGASYYLAQEEVAPYIGAGIMPRLMFTGQGDGSPANVAAYVQAGLMFARASSTRLYADIRVAQNVLPLYRATYPYVDPYGYPDYSRPHETRHLPTEVGIQVGIGW